MTPPVGLCQIGNVVASGVAVPAKECPQSWHFDGSYCGGPKRKIISRAIRGGGDQRQLMENPRP